MGTAALIGGLRRRWGMPSRFGLSRAGVGRRGREIVLALALLVPLVGGVGRALAIDPAALHAPLRADAIPPGELFPHLYGPLRLDAVRSVDTMPTSA